jgi:hypothetical protein
MTSANDITATSTNSLPINDANPLDHHSDDRVSAIANTPDHDPTQTSRYPGWFHDLIRHLRRYGPWRLLIKSDNTIDLEYLAALALRTQQRASRAYLPAQQLSLFPVPEELTLVTANLRRREHPAMPSFTVITGANQPDKQNTITLPDEVLTIKSGEQLHQYLQRVADAAVAATIEAYGSQQAALARLGSKTHTLSPARPALSLAPIPSSKTQDRNRPP